jgi:hypothetical protein
MPWGSLSYAAHAVMRWNLDQSGLTEFIATQGAPTKALHPGFAAPFEDPGRQIPLLSALSFTQAPLQVTVTPGRGKMFHSSQARLDCR